MKRFACFVFLAAALSTSAWADCSYPRAPGKFPNGATSTRDEMVAAKKLVDKYNLEMNDYLTCIKTEHDAAAAKNPAQAEEQKQQLAARYTQKNDAAVDELQEVAGRFNEQLRAFKAKSAK
jgi:hypothetical protein